MYCGYSNPEEFLIHLENTDAEGFLKGVSNWNNHRPLLLLALALTQGEVREFGAGEGSTEYLRAHCLKWQRIFYSFDSSKEYAAAHNSTYVENWDDHPEIFTDCDVALVDHAPGEHRWKAIEYLANKAKMIIVHDSEEGGAGDYKLDKIWHLFKYRLNFNKTGGGAGATLLSNTIDVTAFAGLQLGEFKFDKA